MEYVIRILLWSWLTASLSQICLANSMFNDGKSCNGREILTDKSGVVTDGPGDYLKQSNCEWLIIGGAYGKHISLTFTSFLTECNFDFVYVYDGASYHSPLLASLSGKNLPQPILASSGYMLIHMFSDRNSQFSGFTAEYCVMQCPLNCSGRGQCVNGTCACDSINWIGPACEVDRFPDDCFRFARRGSPFHDGCACNETFHGDSCGFTFTAGVYTNSWFYVTRDALFGRAAHTGVFFDESQTFWIFGGRTLDEVFNDVIYYDFSKRDNQWTVLDQSNPWPARRYLHAAVRWRAGFFIYGGILADDSVSNEMWYFNVTSKKWSRVFFDSKNGTGDGAPPLAGHTLTLVGDWLYIVGGKTAAGFISHEIYRIDCRAPTTWQRVVPRSGKPSSYHVVGHTTVYHAALNSLFVFGGFQLSKVQYSPLTNTLRVFHLDTSSWVTLGHEDRELDDMPPPIAYHSAVLSNDYMIVYGGNVLHSQDCFSDRVYYYHIGCHEWVNPSFFDAYYPDDYNGPYPTSLRVKPRARFGHAAALANGNSLLIMGGYSGVILKDFVAFKLPPSITQEIDSGEKSSKDACEAYSRTDCLEDKSCGVCETNEVFKCMSRKRSCNGTFSSKCKSACLSLTTCQACVGLSSNISLTGWMYASSLSCHWCVKHRRCQHVSDKCATQGWWGRDESIADLPDCHTRDFPAGLQWLMYRPPQNLSYPDNVTILPATKASMAFEKRFNNELNVADATLNYRSRLIGYVHPVGGKDVEMCLQDVELESELFLSKTADRSQMESVCRIKPDGVFCVECVRPDKSQLFGNQKLYFEHRTQYEVTRNKASNARFSVNTRSDKWPYSPIPLKFLEPYSSTDCSQYTNCMACLSDANCGWCTATSSCARRTESILSGAACGPRAPVDLILMSQDCPICIDYRACQTCTQDALCEWTMEQAACTRRGRYSNAVRDPAYCPPQCHELSSCQECVRPGMNCTWCSALEKCFPFPEYNAAYMYGQCKEWSDSQVRVPCRNCASHTTCQQCFTDLCCGWCGHVANPTVGRCYSGDFSGAASMLNCSTIIAEVFNTSASEPAAWSYQRCPDIEECVLGLDDCHANATCHNTPESFNCTCNRGFVGDGRTECNETCYEDCLHGACVGPPFVCDCDLGWTGAACNVSCGCHNHSTCVTGAGVCDACQNHTRGEHCQMCTVGAYGNATSTQGCSVCDCNRHGDSARGICDSQTGVCYCTPKSHAVGTKCETCQPGTYGDARNGGVCYINCHDRLYLTNMSDYLGTYSGPGVSDWPHRIACMWVHDALIPSHQTVITFQPDLAIYCPEDYVYIYEGVPAFTNRSGQMDVLVAAVCGEKFPQPIQVTVPSSQFTIIYHVNTIKKSPTRGFNASYSIIPLCDDCDKSGCPRNCSSPNGLCTKLTNPFLNSSTWYCRCQSGYTGSDCSHELSPLLNSSGIDYSPIPLPNRGFSFVQCDDQRAYMFGGFTVNTGAVNHHFVFDVASNHWSLIQNDNSAVPSPRYQQAAVCMRESKSILMYGGLVRSGVRQSSYDVTHELWAYYYVTNRWSLHSGPSQDIPALAGHTMTYIGNARFVLIGGFSASSYFNHYIYLYDSTQTNPWSKLATYGDKPIGIYGHSSVYKASGHSVYVMGGYSYWSDKLSFSPSVFVLDLKSLRWTWLPAATNVVPNTVMWHGFVSMGNYLVMTAGMTNAYLPGVRAYMFDYTCQQWIRFPELEQDALDDHVTSTIVIGSLLYTFTRHNSRGTFIRSTSWSLEQKPCYNIINNATRCDETRGCSSCVIKYHAKLSICFSEYNGIPNRCNKRKVKFKFMCSNVVSPSQKCSEASSCVQCLATASSSQQSSCMWCKRCTDGFCTKRSQSCPASNDCLSVGFRFTDPSSCSNLACKAASCPLCPYSGVIGCKWINTCPHGNKHSGSHCKWICQNSNSVAQKTVCPVMCYLYKTCTQCLRSPGGEGGANGCAWSDSLQRCFTPGALPLYCQHGECGLILSGSPESCPVPCENHSMCRECVLAPNCGWCSLNNNGYGLCMAGSMYEPLYGRCARPGLSLGTGRLPDRLDGWQAQSVGEAHWNYMSCPPENECENNHHDCDADREQCRDTPAAFECVCKTDYERSNGIGGCMPVCRAGCVQGTCVTPNVCECQFGWVGSNCSVECQCNRHSNCRSVTETQICEKCHNNTQGKQCEECEILHVGDPRSGPCYPCLTFCHNHTDLCVSKDDYNKLDIITRNSILHGVKNGSSQENARCVFCENNTTGDRCDMCRPGHFRIEKISDRFTPCQLCMCNGHSDVCDPATGEKCECKNHTRTNCDPSSNDCRFKQCGDCVEYFAGNPENNHPCYRLMDLDKEYCFDPDTQNRCSDKPMPLHKGQTVLFTVSPKYLNVDIRMTIDVTQGGIDVYISHQEDMFIVEEDKKFGIQYVRYDSKYVRHKTKRSAQKHRRSISTEYQLSTQTATKLNTFVTVTKRNTVLLVRNVRDRLVVTLLDSIFDMEHSKFYIIVYGTGSSATNGTLGNMYFRQDQPHIDLFVFFSVFFSCFFLFLAVCVLLWKLKQTVDSRRNEQQREREMQHMASRPFASVIVLISDSMIEKVPSNRLPAMDGDTIRRHVTKVMPRCVNAPESPVLPSINASVKEQERAAFQVYPIAVEPTEDVIAAIGTVVIHLAGGERGCHRVCLGSALMTRVLPPMVTNVKAPSRAVLTTSA